MPIKGGPIIYKFLLKQPIRANKIYAEARYKSATQPPSIILSKENESPILCISSAIGIAMPAKATIAG